jgi:hypothetical protein
MKAIATALVILGFYLFFYRLVVKSWGRAAQAILEPLLPGTRHSRREIDAVGKLAAAGIAQLLLAVALVLTLGVDLGSILHFRLDLILLGSLLGIGEFALAGFLCTIVLAVAVGAHPASRGQTGRDLLARARGGWMGYFVMTARAAPAWLAALTIVLYVAVEEIVFRGILVGVWAHYPAGIAIGVSSGIFVVAQVISMPGVRAALFPMIGAAVVGPVHAALFLEVGDIVPLIVAHLIFFTGALQFAKQDIRNPISVGI